MPKRVCRPSPVVKLKVPIHVDAKAADNWEAVH